MKGGHLLQGAKQGEQGANAQGAQLPIGLQAGFFKGKLRGQGCRVCAQVVPTLPAGQW